MACGEADIGDKGWGQCPQYVIPDHFEVQYRKGLLHFTLRNPKSLFALSHFTCLEVNVVQNRVPSFELKTPLFAFPRKLRMPLWPNWYRRKVESLWSLVSVQVRILPGVPSCSRAAAEWCHEPFKGATILMAQ